MIRALDKISFNSDTIHNVLLWIENCHMFTLYSKGRCCYKLMYIWNWECPWCKTIILFNETLIVSGQKTFFFGNLRIRVLIHTPPFQNTGGGGCGNGHTDTHNHNHNSHHNHHNHFKVYFFYFYCFVEEPEKVEQVQFFKQYFFARFRF